ncbi:hypothetical protein [Undibacterium pigrum]|uniref:Uncharacterized protein n=1 Tax=Undibacterium pigrum TaxID=401470 RepID=A0A318IP10_9BURK|nr:hypothetical protein [Undibacterium pigrum]PXX33720.1 hypothetical protein DFR42_12916 [Undibacterium pigrum]
MFTPEFINHEKNEYVLVANHSLENQEAINLSLQFNKARIAFGNAHLPEHISSCRIIYDIRGQSLPAATIAQVSKTLESLCIVEFKR